MRAYLQIVLPSLLAMERLGVGGRTRAIGALLHLEEGFLILVCQRDPAFQLGVELELGTIRRLDGDVLAVQLGERDAIVLFKKGRVGWEGENLRNRLVCHFVCADGRLIEGMLSRVTSVVNFSDQGLQPVQGPQKSVHMWGQPGQPASTSTSTYYVHQLPDCRMSSLRRHYSTMGTIIICEPNDT